MVIGSDPQERAWVFLEDRELVEQLLGAEEIRVVFQPMIPGMSTRQMLALERHRNIYTK